MCEIRRNTYGAGVDITPHESIEFELWPDPDTGIWTLELIHQGFGTQTEHNKIYLTPPQIAFVLNSQENGHFIEEIEGVQDRLTVDYNDYRVAYEEDVTNMFGHVHRWGRVIVVTRAIPRFKEVLRECVVIIENNGMSRQ
jgi:hypothetical protein